MSTGQILGGGTGAVIGALLAAPTGGVSLAAGAIYGAQIGIMAGGLLDPPKGPTVEGPRLGDLSVQTSTYGQFIPRTYGTIGLSGNVFWLEKNKLKEVVRKKKSGGKGGGSSSTVKTYTYFATFAVGLCEGPIAGVRRIWVGPDLVYDAGSDDLETIISSNTASGKFTIYLGTDTQQPDPRMQAEMGVANCPAFRGLAYVVVKDLKLANYGNSVAGAQVKVEVVNALSNAPAKLSDSVISGIPYYNNNIATGHPRDSRDMLHYCYYPARFGSVFHVSVRPSGQKIEVEIPIAKTTPNAPFGCQPIAQSLVSSQFAFRANAYISTTSSVTWGNGEDVKVYRYPNTTFTPIAFAESSRYVYLLDGDPSTGLRVIQVESESATGNQATLPVGYDGMMTTWLDSVVFVWPDYSTGLVKVRVYDELLLLVDSYSLALPGIIGPGARYSASFFGCAVVGDDAMVLSSPGATNQQIIKLDMSSRIATAYNIQPTSVFFSPINGAAKNLGGAIASSSPVSGGGSVSSTVWQLNGQTDSQVSLSSIFATETSRSVLIKPADIDSSGLVDSVTGFKVTATGSIRNAIEPLRGAWPFDVVQSGYKIKATSRGSASIVTIQIGELAIDTQLTESREMDSQLPQNVTVKYIDRDRDYDGNEQRAQRDNTEAVNSLVVELPVVLSASQSAQVADKLIRIYALEKSDFSFTLPAPYRYLEPGDVVTIATADADYILRLVSVNHTADGRLECAGRPSSASTYTSIAPGDGGQGGTSTIPLPGATIGILIDCPVIDEGLQNAPGFAVGFDGYSAGWPGGILFRTADNGQTWDDLQALNGRAAAGFASTLLAANAGSLIQRGGTLTVSLISGTLESVTEAQMLNGANIAAYGVNGRWEVIRFQNATLNGNGTYTIDTFWRGDKGTEWATGLHAANDYFVLMTDPDLAFIGMPTDSIGQPRDYRAITSGADIDSAASTAFTYDGVNLETLSGAHPVGTRSAGDLTIAWKRRTRVGGAWRDFVDASLGESLEAYEVDIMQGATVKRTITASTPSVLYTSAQQVTDFGSPQSSVSVNIYQQSSVVGRGYPLGATL